MAGLQLALQYVSVMHSRAARLQRGSPVLLVLLITRSQSEEIEALDLSV